ncbi:type II secretion system F family protein [Nocardioides sp. SYSU DS0651]|uniref:type II secretion system F family protein n=1 Tax=Nocardioides sp. SYSU DS0651 TaxID=3415955 RepID=UPI003F4C7F03
MRARRLLLLLGALLAAFVLPVGPAAAEEGTIAHVESTGEGIRVLVNVPPGVQVMPAGVTATLDGQELRAEAADATESSAVKRTTVLAIDTSGSMARGGRFTAAKEAATTYLDTVPADVEVGIVTFDNQVEVALTPTTDRAAARAVVDDLSLAPKETLLYDGVVAAVKAAGEDGQRSVLVLSDGADTGGTATLQDVTGTVESTSTLVDVVSLGQSGKALDPLRTMAEAGRGRVIESSGAALADAFRTEADVLAGQVLVTAPLPSRFDATEATVEVVLPTDGSEPMVARAFATIQSAPSEAPLAEALPTPTAPGGWNAPGWLLYAGIAVLAVGLISVAVLLVPARPAPMTIAERVEAYSGRPGAADEKVTSKHTAEPVLEQARAAAEGVLERNSGLNDRLVRKLTAAGSEFKPSEWLLVHIGTVFVAGVVGFLMGGVLAGALMMAFGALLPPFYLRFKAARRRRAFEEALPEVLQLLAGALSAGLSLAQAVDTVVREGPEPIASEFRRVLVEARIGVQLEDAFEGVAERFQSQDFAWAVMAIRIQRQVGGNLAELLKTVAATMRERAYLRRQVRTLSAEGRLSAMLLCALPPLFAGYLFLTNRTFLEPLVADPRGWMLSAGGALWLAIGVFWMSRLVKVDI